jgi:NAD(P)-dependent dehydrogenase (short-subunit alcohol dehydrogenase family)
VKTHGIALVTGASRGIGASSATALAARGFDVVVTARTLHEGERFEYGPTQAEAGLRSLPGSLERTAAEVEARGRRALALRMDLLEPASIDRMLDRVQTEWGPVNALVNNAIYQGPGVMDAFLALTPDLLQKIFQGNVLSQVQLTQRVLAEMLRAGSGAIINLTSNAGRNDPPGKVGDGGWGYAYGASKAAFHRMVGALHAEHRDSGVRFYNLDPGYVVTDAVRALVGEDSDLDRHYSGVAPDVPAAAIAWLAESGPEQEELSGRTLAAARLCREFELLAEVPPGVAASAQEPKS